MMRVRDVDPRIKRCFPWALFLALAVVLAISACSLRSARGGEKPWFNPAEWTCEKLKGYLATHNEAEARAKAAELHLPKWIIRRAERCVL
jgi:hypothetical protein